MIRSAVASDYASFAALFPELGAEDATPNLARWLDDLMHHTLVCERDGEVVGYVNFYRLSAIGHVRNLVVAPDARGAGVGGELMRRAADRLRGAGVAEWHLNVKLDNTPAIRLYERLGLIAEHRSTALRIAWSDIERIRSEPSACALPIDPAEDDDIERALGLPAGRIAMSRARPERVLIQLRDDACAPVGFASFDPEFPGAYPFRVSRPAYAGTLMHAIRPHARANDRDLRLVAENDAALVDALIAANATVNLEMLHYRGPL